MAEQLGITTEQAGLSAGKVKLRDRADTSKRQASTDRDHYEHVLPSLGDSLTAPLDEALRAARGPIRRPRPGN